MIPSACERGLQSRWVPLVVRHLATEMGVLTRCAAERLQRHSSVAGDELPIRSSLVSADATNSLCAAS